VPQTQQNKCRALAPEGRIRDFALYHAFFRSSAGVAENTLIQYSLDLHCTHRAQTRSASNANEGGDRSLPSFANARFCRTSAYRLRAVERPQPASPWAPSPR
jgi:hypothetical protein